MGTQGLDPCHVLTVQEIRDDPDLTEDACRPIKTALRKVLLMHQSRARSRTSVGSSVRSSTPAVPISSASSFTRASARLLAVASSVAGDPCTSKQSHLTSMRQIFNSSGVQRS